MRQPARTLWCLGIVAVTVIAASLASSVRADTNLPRVVITAEGIGPRQIEQRTGETVTHDYAQAWHDLAESLNSNRADLLGEYLTGDCKRQLSQRISDQKRAGLRTEYVDHGHDVRAVFYSLDGGMMQLEDRAQLETKIFDGQRTIYTGNSTHFYLVLMTPGADRWLIRSLQEVPEKTF
jgi:hypothetical protein